MMLNDKLKEAFDAFYTKAKVRVKSMPVVEIGIIKISGTEIHKARLIYETSTFYVYYGFYKKTVRVIIVNKENKKQITSDAWMIRRGSWIEKEKLNQISNGILDSIDEIREYSEFCLEVESEAYLNS